MGVAKSNKPDFTAWFVLQGTLAAMNSGFQDNGSDSARVLEIYKILAQEASKTRLLSKIIYSLPYGLQYAIGDLVTDRGRLRHFYLRKKEINKQVRELLANGGFKQVVVLGAGLDALSLALAPEYPAVTFIEIDRKESQAFKISSLQAHKVKIPDNLEFIEGDLRDPLVSILASSRFHDPKAKTLWVAEGLLMFIPVDGVIQIFKQIKNNSAVSSYSVFTTLEYKNKGTVFSRIVQKLYLSKEKCPFEWSVASEQIPEFMKNLGYRVVEQIPCELLHKGYINAKYNINHKIGDDIHRVEVID
jgi:methyltransferase (TIGR00027 family)